MLDDKISEDAVSSSIGRGIQIMLLEWTAERNYQVGIIVDSLIRMYKYADKIRKHQSPYIEPTHAAFFGIALKEFKGTSAGIKIARRYPKAMKELEGAYDSVNRYASRRESQSTIHTEQQVNQVVKWLKKK